MRFLQLRPQLFVLVSQDIELLLLGFEHRFAFIKELISETFLLGSLRELELVLSGFQLQLHVLLVLASGHPDDLQILFVLHLKG